MKPRPRGCGQTEWLHERRWVVVELARQGGSGWGEGRDEKWSRVVKGWKRSGEGASGAPEVGFFPCGCHVPLVRPRIVGGIRLVGKGREGKMIAGPRMAG